MSRPEEFKTFVENVAKKLDIDLEYDYDPQIGVFCVKFKDGIFTEEIHATEEELENRLLWGEIESLAVELKKFKSELATAN